MNRLLSRAALLGATLLAAASAHAVVFNIDFGTDFGNPLEGYAAAGGAGRWNWIQNGDPKELYDGGYNYQTTPVMLTVSADEYQGSSTSSDPLFSDFFYSYGGSDPSWSVAITGLSDGAYDVYYYAPNHPYLVTGDFTINGLGVSSINGGSVAAGSLIKGSSWDVAQSVVVSGGTLTLQAKPMAGADFIGLAGLQIISIPEPATYAALMGGAVLLGAMVWRRRKQ